MPELITISGARHPDNKKNTKVRLEPATDKLMDRVIRGLKTAKIKDAIEYIGLAYRALSNHDYKSAIHSTIEAVVRAGAAYRMDPKTATQVYVTAHKIAQMAVKQSLAKTA